VSRIVGILSEKGGVGKTTACYHLAVGLHCFHQKRVLVVDADYQRGGLSGRCFPDIIESFGRGSVAGTSLFHKFQQLYSASPLTTDVDVRAWRNEMDVLVADPRLASVSVDKLPATNNIRQNNLSLLSHLQVEGRILDAISDRYDYILIDSHLRYLMCCDQYCLRAITLCLRASLTDNPLWGLPP
jgi:chromosome partitioning protein